MRLQSYYSVFEGLISGENKTKLKQYWMANVTLTALIVVLSQRWLKLKECQLIGLLLWNSLLNRHLIFPRDFKLWFIPNNLWPLIFKKMIRYWKLHVNYCRVRELSFILTFLILESENVPNIKPSALLIHESKQVWRANCKLVGCCQCPIAHAVLNPKCQPCAMNFPGQFWWI